MSLYKMDKGGVPCLVSMLGFEALEKVGCFLLCGFRDGHGGLGVGVDGSKCDEEKEAEDDEQQTEGIRPKQTERAVLKSRVDSEQGNCMERELSTSPARQQVPMPGRVALFNMSRKGIEGREGKQPLSTWPMEGVCLTIRD
jgi:hypothetical protein